MRTKRRVIRLSLFLSTMLSSLIIFTSPAFADTKHVTFNEPVTIANTVLKPGIYQVVWSGDGPVVQVSFLRGSKTVATVSAKLVLEKSSTRRVETLTSPDNSQALKRLVFSRKSLNFDLSSGPDVPQERPVT